MLQLAENLQMQLYLQEFILERRAFAAHITLVRKAREPGSFPGCARRVAGERVPAGPLDLRPLRALERFPIA